MNDPRKIIAIGASSGGIGALKRIFASLDADFPAPILVVLHIGAYESVLPSMFAPVCKLAVRHAHNGDPVQPGCILIAPPNQHMLVDRGRIRLSRGAKENYARPAIDPLFRSAAVAYKNQVIGLVLTGHMDDGTVGLQAVKAYGGLAMIQDPTDAEVPSMPASAMNYVDVDYILPLADIAPTQIKLTRVPTATTAFTGDDKVLLMENELALTGNCNEAMLDRIGTRSDQICPEYGGVMWQIQNAVPLRFRCHTGHAFMAQSLLSEQSNSTEEAVWAAVRALHEKQTLLRRLADDARKRNRDQVADDYDAGALAAERHGAALRKLISQLG